MKRVSEFRGGLEFCGVLFKREVDEGLIQPVKNFAIGTVNNFARYISQDIKAIKKGFQELSQKIKQIPQKIVKIFRGKPKPEIPEEIFTQEEIERLIAENFATKEQLEQFQQKLEELKRTMTQLEDLIKANLYSGNEDVLRKIRELKKINKK